VDSKEHKQPQWAPQVPLEQVRKLYENSAKGIIDEELIDEIGYGLYVRCESIVTVTDAVHGRVQCPSCAEGIPFKTHHKEKLIECSKCDWQLLWGTYLKTYQKKQLHGGAVGEFFAEFIRKWPGAVKTGEKIVLIDTLLHYYHVGLMQEKTRPVAQNLIQGKMVDVIKLLEELSYGADATEEMKQRHEEWKKTADSNLREWGIRK
jgi:ribosomal protein L37AE/L43A